MSEEMKNTMNEVSAEELTGAAGGAAASGYVTYKVVKGDTLFKIGKRFGVTVDQLVAWNNIKNRDLILVGQVLKIYL